MSEVMSNLLMQCQISFRMQYMLNISLLHTKPYFLQKKRKKKNLRVYFSFYKRRKQIVFKTLAQHAICSATVKNKKQNNDNGKLTLNLNFEKN